MLNGEIIKYELKEENGLQPNFLNFDRCVSNDKNKKFERVSLHSAYNLRNHSILNGIWENIIFDSFSCVDVNFEKFIFENCVFGNNGADRTWIDCTSFKKCTFKNCIFNNCQMRWVSWIDCIFENVKLNTTYIRASKITKKSKFINTEIKISQIDEYFYTEGKRHPVNVFNDFTLLLD